MRITCSIAIAVVALVVGCNVQTGLAPTETVITNCSDRDFGFTGIWIPVPDATFPHDVATHEMAIDRDEAYTASLYDTTSRNGDELKITFRTHEISDDRPHAIVEIELVADDKIAYRRLAVAAVEKDHLFLWMIDGREIGERLYKDGVAAVIEHSTYSTTVRCNPEKLLDSLSKHAGEIVGNAQVFRRKPADGG